MTELSPAMDERLRKMEEWRAAMDVRIAQMNLSLTANTVLTESIDRKVNQVLAQGDTRKAVVSILKWTVTTAITALAAFAAFHAH